MDEDRSIDTAHGQYLLKRFGMGSDVDSKVAAADAECKQNGHQWGDRDRLLCLHCGMAWPPPGATA